MVHLVLDLDETLVHSDEMRASDERRMRRAPDYDLGDMQGYYRPGLRAFLAWAFRTFESVGVWTAGSGDYAESIIDVVFKQQKLPLPKYVLSADDCEPKLENIGWHRYTRLQYKPLKKLWALCPELNAANTLVLDDRTDTACENTSNLLLIPAFSVRAPDAIGDDYLLRLQNFIKHNSVAELSDVRDIDKSTWWIE